MPERSLWSIKRLLTLRHQDLATRVTSKVIVVNRIMPSSITAQRSNVNPDFRSIGVVSIDAYAIDDVHLFSNIDFGSNRREGTDSCGKNRFLYSSFKEQSRARECELNRQSFTSEVNCSDRLRCLKPFG